MTIEDLFNEKTIDEIFDTVCINETRELMIKLFLGNEKAFIRAEIIDILEAYHLKKHGKRKKYAWTTVYDNLNALLIEGVIMKYPNPNPLGRGRPVIKWKIGNKDLAKALLKEYNARNS